jgi:hypothetical protein
VHRNPIAHVAHQRSLTETQSDVLGRHLKNHAESTRVDPDEDAISSPSDDDEQIESQTQLAQAFGEPGPTPNFPGRRQTYDQQQSIEISIDHDTNDHSMEFARQISPPSSRSGSNYPAMPAGQQTWTGQELNATMTNEQEIIQPPPPLNGDIQNWNIDVTCGNAPMSIQVGEEGTIYTANATFLQAQATSNAGPRARSMHDWNQSNTAGQDPTANNIGEFIQEPDGFPISDDFQVWFDQFDRSQGLAEQQHAIFEINGKSILDQGFGVSPANDHSMQVLSPTNTSPKDSVPVEFRATSRISVWVQYRV